jgi:hypothetical protein
MGRTPWECDRTHQSGLRGAGSVWGEPARRVHGQSGPARGGHAPVAFPTACVVWRRCVGARGASKTKTAVSGVGHHLEQLGSVYISSAWSRRVQNGAPVGLSCSKPARAVVKGVRKVFGSRK